ncbi:MAG TPA: hypothetical protein PKA10_13970 [Selenomonadales bacterium]|nr:hypothetical protein [Selenomonadales bacterium]
MIEEATQEYTSEQIYIDTIESMEGYIEIQQQEIENLKYNNDYQQNVIRKQIEDKQKALEKTKKRNKNFVKMHVDGNQWIILQSGFTHTLQWLFFSLGAFCNREGYVAYKGKTLSIKEIAKLLKVNYDNLRKDISTLEHKQILHKIKQGKNTIIQLDPIYFSKS